MSIDGLMLPWRLKIAVQGTQPCQIWVEVQSRGDIFSIHNQETKYWLKTLNVFGPREVTVPRADIMEKNLPETSDISRYSPKKQQFIFRMGMKYIFCEEGYEIWNVICFKFRQQNLKCIQILKTDIRTYKICQSYFKLQERCHLLRDTV